jgi:hypothetical protein
MKKYYSMVFAAIRPLMFSMAFCGAIATVFTACSKDDDDNKTPVQPKDDQKATKGDVTLTFVAQPKSLQYFEYDFKYIDAKGNTKTVDIDEKTQSTGSLDDLEIGFYKNTISALAQDPEYADLNNPFVYRVVLKDQPVGGKVTYTTVCHVKEGATITETLRYATPLVISSKRLENSERVLVSSIFSFNSQRVSPEQWNEYITKMEGKEIREASGEVSLNN